MSIDPHVAITTREIYDAVLKLTGKVEVVILQQAENNKDLADHETRLRDLERSRWPIPTVALLISLAAFILTAIKFAS